jgi:hypothetical protein
MLRAMRQQTDKYASSVLWEWKVLQWPVGDYLPIVGMKSLRSLSVLGVLATPADVPRALGKLMPKRCTEKTR